MQRKLSPGNLTILIAGALCFVGSFLPFYTVKLFGQHASVNAWDHVYRGNTTLPALLGAIMAAQVALTVVAHVRLPQRVLGFSWNQIHLLLGFQATVMMAAWLVRQRGGLDFGVGFYLMLVASIALFVGAGMRNREPMLY